MKASITTFEFDNGKWTPVLTHTFHGKDRKEIKQIIEAHKGSDSFFAGSFKGEWNGIQLKNSKIEYDNEFLSF